MGIVTENTNRVQNGGFEESDFENQNIGPFWTSEGGVVIGRNGPQLLGQQNANLLIDASISQELLTLDPGKIYEFRFSVSASGAIPATGTIDIAIDGVPVQSFQAGNLVSINAYVMYAFTFEALDANPTLTITNNSNHSISIDEVSVFRK